MFECGRTILWVMLCIVSWSQGLVMAKDPCEATTTKRLAWLVEQLVVSSHEFYFTLLWNLISKLFYHFFYQCFHKLLSSPLFHLLFCFSKSLLFYFHIANSSPSSPSTFGFLFFFFYLFSFFNKEELVNITRERTVNSSIASCPRRFDPLSNAITEVLREY